MAFSHSLKTTSAQLSVHSKVYTRSHKLLVQHALRTTYEHEPLEEQHENFATFQSKDQPRRCINFGIIIPTLGPLHGQQRVGTIIKKIVTSTNQLKTTPCGLSIAYNVRTPYQCNLLQETPFPNLLHTQLPNMTWSKKNHHITKPSQHK